MNNNNITELNLYLHERRQIESDHYIDSSIINLPIEVEKKKKEEVLIINMNTSMKSKYRLGLGREKERQDIVGR